MEVTEFRNFLAGVLAEKEELRAQWVDPAWAEERARQEAARQEEQYFLSQLMRYEGAALRLARRELGTTQDAEDAVQDSLISALKNRATFDPGKGTLKNWFLKIVGRRVVDLRRRASGRLWPNETPPRYARPHVVSVEDMISWEMRNTNPECVSEPPEIDRSDTWASSADDPASPENTRLLEIQLAIKRLPSDQQQAVTLRTSGYSYREIGDVMGVSKSQVHRLIADARQTIRTFLEV